MNEHEHTPVDEQLEARLAAMTTWTGSVEGERGGPLARALATTANDTPAVVGTIGFWRGLSKRQIAAVLVVAAGGVLVAGMVVPTSEPTLRIGKDLGSAETSEVTGIMFDPSVVSRWESDPRKVPTPDLGLFAAGSMSVDGQERFGNAVVGGIVGSDGRASGNAHHRQRNFDVASGPASPPPENFQALGAANGSLGLPQRLASDTEVPSNRQIIRRAMVDVVATDVQVAFRKAQDLVKVELGEFVQESTLSGSGDAMSGRVVLRLEPSRLADVMQATRGLGELAAEQTGGDDVTDRLTDLEAQIRNEERVEKEMLELFDLRKDAPLKEVLELREQLARVRGNIERMQASKAQIGRLVSLATLSITIRPKPDVVVAPPPVDETPSFGARLGSELGRSWDRATNNLVSSAGWMVEKAIGGLPTWTVLGVTGFVIWRVVRKRQKKA